MNRSRHTPERNVANEACNTNEWVTHMNGSCHTPARDVPKARDTMSIAHCTTPQHTATHCKTHQRGTSQKRAKKWDLDAPHAPAPRHMESAWTSRAAVCCSVVQWGVVWWSVRYSTLHCLAVCCSALQCVAVCCSMLQCVAVCCSVLQCVAVRASASSYGIHVNVTCCSACCCACCSVLQCVAVCCNVRGIVAFNFSPRNLTQVTSAMKTVQGAMIDFTSVKRVSLPQELYWRSN